MRSDLRWPRVLVLSALVAAAVAVVLVAPLGIHALETAEELRLSSPAPIPATPETQRRIVREIFGPTTSTSMRPNPPPPPSASGPMQQPVAGPAPPLIILLDYSASFCAGESQGSVSSCSEHFMDDSIASGELDQEIPRKLRQELLLANRASTAIPDPGLPGVVYESRAALAELMSGKDGWSAFYAKFPDSAGFARVSQAVLSEDGTHALIYVSHHCHWTCGTGSLRYLEKTRAGWRVTKFVGLWMS